MRALRKIAKYNVLWVHAPIRCSTGMVQGKMSSRDRNMQRTEMVHAPMVQEGSSRQGENKLKLPTMAMGKVTIWM